MPDDSPQPQPATPPERIDDATLAGAIRCIAAQPSHTITRLLLERAAETIERQQRENKRTRLALLWVAQTPPASGITGIEKWVRLAKKVAHEALKGLA